MQIVLFEDDRVAQLAPLAAAEPAFAITCGGYKLVQLVGALGPELTVVRKHLAAVEAETFPNRVPSAGSIQGPVLFVNARLVPSIAVFGRLKALAESGREGIVLGGEKKDAIAAALVTQNTVELRSKSNVAPSPQPSSRGRGSEAAAPSIQQAQGLQSLGLGAVDTQIRQLALPTLQVDLPLFDYPHEVLKHHLACCREDLEYRVRTGSPQSYPTAGGQKVVPHAGYKEIRDGLFVGENVSLGEHLVADTKNGPIVIDHDAVIGPFCFLRGPVYIGPCAKVNEHAALKDGVSLGHHCKVGGEVEASIVEPYSNKQHHGFLGHSYVGSWVNLGAGTSNSDLKNTYGTIRIESNDGHGGVQKISTGMQFVGCMIGDYVKTAINTSIFTGKTIGACSMAYGFVTENVPSFCNYAKTFGQVTDLTAEVMLTIQQRMFARRQVPQRECDRQLIRDLYELAQQERTLPSEPLRL